MCFSGKHTQELPEKNSKQQSLESFIFQLDCHIQYYFVQKEIFCILIDGMIKKIIWQHQIFDILCVYERTEKKMGKKREKIIVLSQNDLRFSTIITYILL